MTDFRRAMRRRFPAQAVFRVCWSRLAAPVPSAPLDALRPGPPLDHTNPYPCPGCLHHQVLILILLCQRAAACAAGLKPHVPTSSRAAAGDTRPLILQCLPLSPRLGSRILRRRIGGYSSLHRPPCERTKLPPQAGHSLTEQTEAAVPQRCRFPPIPDLFQILV